MAGAPSLRLDTRNDPNLVNDDAALFNPPQSNVPPDTNTSRFALGTIPDVPPNGAPASSPDHYLTVLFFTDFHGNIKNAAKLAYLINKIRTENKNAGPNHGTLLLVGGDLFTGTTASELFKGQAEAAFMRYINPDAYGFGNHDEDFGEAAFQAAKPPHAIAANFYVNGKPYLEPSVIVNAAGLKVSVIGLVLSDMTTQMNRTVVESMKPTVAPPWTVINPFLQGVVGNTDVQIALTHQGPEGDKLLAEAAAKKGLDLIIGGHDHRVVECVPVSDIPVCATKDSGLMLGRIDLKVTDRKKVEKVGQEFIKIDDSVPEDPGAVDVLRGYIYGAEVEGEKRLSTKIGYATKAYTKTPIESEKEYEQTPIGRLITGAIREVGRADIGMMNSGGIRDILKEGDITLGDIGKVYPFHDQLVTISVTGKQIVDVLELQLNPPPGGRVKYFQSSGLSYADIHDPKKFDPNKTYTVALPFFTAGLFKDANGDPIKSASTGKEVSESLIEYIKKHKRI